MVKSRIVRATAVAATSLGFLAAVTGIAGASSGMSTLDHTGPQSTNNVKQINKQHASVENTNHVSLYSNNSQGASSGDATATDNTTAGGASSGNASNSSSVSANLTVHNSMPDMMGGDGDGSATSTVSNTGPQSSNNVVQVNKSSVKVSNDNTICLTTTNSQEASTGDATVSDNTTGGSASTGNASNTSSSSFTLNVTN